MKKTFKFASLVFVISLAGGDSSFLKAAHEQVVLPAQVWSFDGPFGTFDKAQLQRGFQVYKEVCSACHSMKLLSYRNLSALGFSEAEIKAIARQNSVPGAPNDAGDVVDRPALPSDRFRSPYPNEQAARAANNGALPVDMSLIASARKGGADYIHALMMGYEAAPADMKIAEGMHYNKYFAGHQIAMTAPLSEGQVTYADGTPTSVDQMASDVAAFLYWAANPHMEQRKRVGVMVMVYMLIFTALLYMTMKRIWSRVDH